MLAELLLHRGDVVSRGHLVDAVWGEDAPAAAAGSLQVYVHGLRRALGAGRIETHGSGYRFCAEPEEVDAARFQRLLEDARRSLAGGAPAAAEEQLVRALALWQGEALADLERHPVAAAAAQLEELRLQAHELLVDARLALGGHAELVPALEERIAAEPYRERLREQYVLALYRAGRQKDALEAYRAARRMLVDELGVEPGPGLQELERAILRQDPALAAGSAPRGVRARLPAPVSPLVGRRLELAAVQSILRRDDVRLVTLTGPGGSGKTRLALAVAEALAPGLRDCAAFVDLSSITDAALVRPRVAQALEVDDPAELAARLQGASLLLVLDNLEQLEDAAEPIAGLLRDAPGLRVVATSRMPVRLSGEHEYPVPPLPVADPGRPLAEIAASEAVALFAARAGAVDPSFALTAATAPAVARICRRLDGLPLAIELAAARVRALPLAAIEERLERALDLLVGGARDLPARQRTLRATLDWSNALLGEDERLLLARTSVFAGGFTLDALAGVLGGDPALGLEALVEASLVRRRGERFHLLETVREYALERLRACGEEQEYRRRHVAWFLELAERAWASILEGGDAEAQGLRLLDDEQDNLRGALAWAIEAGDVETEVRLLETQRWLWLVRGRISEGRSSFDHAVAAGAREPHLRAKALGGAATFASRAGDLDAAEAQWAGALEIYRELDEPNEIGRCTAELGGVAVERGDLARAEALYRESVAVFERHGHAPRMAVALSNLAAIASMRGELDFASEYGHRAIEIQRGLDDRGGLCVSLASLAPVLLELDRVEEARTALAEALALGVELEHNLLLAHGLGAAAALARRDGQPEHAVRLVGASRASFEAIGMPLPDAESRLHEQTLAAARAALGGATVEALLTAGHETDMQRAVQDARRIAGGV